MVGGGVVGGKMRGKMGWAGLGYDRCWKGGGFGSGGQGEVARSGGGGFERLSAPKKKGSENSLNEGSFFFFWNSHTHFRTLFLLGRGEGLRERGEGMR